jgi:hypothetical protein
MQLSPPDATKLLQAWMEWERGDVTPGRAMANLKTGGLRRLLEGLATAEAPPAVPSEPAPADATGTSTGPFTGPFTGPSTGGPGGAPPSWAPTA